MSSYKNSGLFGTSGMQGNFSAMSTSFTGSSFLPDEDDVRTSSSANAASMTGPMKTATGTPGGSASAASAAGNTSGASAGYVPSMLFQRHGSAATSQASPADDNKSGRPQVQSTPSQGLTRSSSPMQAFLERGYSLRSGAQQRPSRTIVTPGAAASDLADTSASAGGIPTTAPRTSSRLRGGRAAPPPRRSLLDDPSGVLGASASNMAGQKSPAFIKSATATTPKLSRTPGTVDRSVMWADQSMAATGAGDEAEAAGALSSRGAFMLGGTPGASGIRAMAGTPSGSSVYPQYGTRTSVDALNEMHAEAQLGSATLNTPNMTRYGTSTMGASNQLVTTTEEGDRVWNRWVVVFGFAADPRGLNNILRKFQEFGEIETYRVSNGNYLFLRYSNPHAALAAEQLNGQCITVVGTPRAGTSGLSSIAMGAGGRQMLGVKRLSMDASCDELRDILASLPATSTGASPLINTQAAAITPGRLPGSAPRGSAYEEDVASFEQRYLGTPTSRGDGVGLVRRRGTPGSAHRAAATVNTRYLRAAPSTPALDGDDADSVMLRAAPRRKKDICTKIYEFFFLY